MPVLLCYVENNPEDDRDNYWCAMNLEPGERGKLLHVLQAGLSELVRVRPKGEPTPVHVGYASPVPIRWFHDGPPELSGPVTEIRRERDPADDDGLEPRCYLLRLDAKAEAVYREWAPAVQQWEEMGQDLEVVLTVVEAGGRMVMFETVPLTDDDPALIGFSVPLSEMMRMVCDG